MMDGAATAPLTTLSPPMSLPPSLPMSLPLSRPLSAPSPAGRLGAVAPRAHAADSRTAALPMYDADREGVAAWWRAIAAALGARSLGGVPRDVVWPEDLHAHWRDPALLLSQTCGLPLASGRLGAVQVVGAFRHAAPGCEGIGYRSLLVARRGDPGDSIGDFRGRVAAINDPWSHSGCNALRAHVAPHAQAGRFFAREIVSGSHRESLRLVRQGQADLAAIDCVSLAAWRRREPSLLGDFKVIGRTASAPGLPLITAAATSATELLVLREALAAVCADPALAGLRRRLDILAFEAAPAETWQVIEQVRQRAGRAWPLRP